MAFKSFSQYQEEKNGEFFVLSHDKDSADVIFLYRRAEDVMVGDVHWISSPTYKGYAHCCGPNCPACAYRSPKGGTIQLVHKIFIPLYNITKGKVEFWSRSTFFESELQKQVFAYFPNPSEAIFTVTRDGEANSRDTKYRIVSTARNNLMSYDEIMQKFNLSFPDSYSIICREMTVDEMHEALYPQNAHPDLPDYNYTPVPRGESVAPSVTVPTPEYSAPPEVAPPAVDSFDVEQMSGAVSESEDDSNDSLDDVNF